MEVSVKGLIGGHSGDDINKKRANAIKLIGRFLYMEQSKIDVRLAAWNSGKLDNAIPRDGKAVFAVPADKKEEVMADWNVFTRVLKKSITCLTLTLYGEWKAQRRVR